MFTIRIVVDPSVAKSAVQRLFRPVKTGVKHECCGGSREFIFHEVYRHAHESCFDLYSKVECCIFDTFSATRS